MRRATALARSRSPEVIAPDSPYFESLAMRTASSSSSNGIITSTGPKISSWAMVIELSTSAKIVGSTNQPLGRCVGDAAAAHEPGALRLALLDVAEHPLALALPRPAGP